MKTISNAGIGLSSGLPHSGTASVPDMVYRGVQRCDRLHPRYVRDCTPAQRVARLERIAELFRREARWWGVLTAWSAHCLEPSVPWVFTVSAINSQMLAIEHACEYERMAEDARRRIAVLAGER